MDRDQFSSNSVLDEYRAFWEVKLRNGLFHFFIYHVYDFYLPIPVAERSKAWVCSRSLAGIAGSNPAECCVFVR